jgi:hypothetical protein
LICRSESLAPIEETIVCHTNEDDEDFEYGKEYVHTPDTAIEESNKLYPLDSSDIWPHWNEGVPTKLRRRVHSPAFKLGNVQHNERPYLETLEIAWQRSHLVETLKKNYNLLPSGRYSSQWSGVYRIFIPDTAIGRVCETDQTGTLYIGRAGSERGWSILRGRLMQVAKREHHATRWWYSSPIGEKFPWSSVAVHWAFTPPRMNYKGETIPSSRMAESWLLWCYNDSFGEYPPLNQEG